jgi:phospholipase D1/2
LNRQPFQRWLFSKFTKSRIHFILDDHHPLTASHHQKLVVIDGYIAYCGGIDLTSARWDSSQHLSQDHRRLSPNGKAYPPFHDVSIRIEGKAVHHIYSLARKRWYDAGGIAVKTKAQVNSHSTLTNDFNHSIVAISRTKPSFLNHPGIREIEKLYLDLIKLSKHYIYIENQYFASQTISKALAKSLQHPHGPEIIIITTPHHEGWLEERTMGAIRNKLLSSLYESDIHHRLAVYTPHVRGNKYTLHSKIMIIDNTYAVIGSANLNNRSMGLDSECNITLSAADNKLTQTSINNFMNELLSEHLGVKKIDIEAQFRQQRSYIKTINSLQSSEKKLSGYRTRVNDWMMNFISDIGIIDPKRPFDLEQDFDKILFTTWLTNLKMIGFICNTIGLILGLYILFITSMQLHEGLIPLATLVLTSPTLISSIVFISCLMIGLILIPFVLQVFIITNITSFWYAPLISLMTCLLSMSISYYYGKWLGPSFINRHLIVRPHIIYQRLRGTGLLPIIFTRLFLWLPFSAINIVAGSAAVKKKRFFLGSIIAMFPKILVYTGLYASTKTYVLSGNLKSLSFGFLYLLMILSWFAFIVNRYRFLNRAWHMDR